MFSMAPVRMPTSGMTSALTLSVSKWTMSYSVLLLVSIILRIFDVLPGVIRLDALAGASVSPVENPASATSVSFARLCGVFAASASLMASIHLALLALMVMNSTDPSVYRMPKVTGLGWLGLVTGTTSLAFAVAASLDRAGTLLAGGDVRSFLWIPVASIIRYIWHLPAWEGLARQVIAAHGAGLADQHGSETGAPWECEECAIHSGDIHDAVVRLSPDHMAVMLCVAVGHSTKFWGLCGVVAWFAAGLHRRWQSTFGSSSTVSASEYVTRGDTSGRTCGHKPQGRSRLSASGDSGQPNGGSATCVRARDRSGSWPRQAIDQQGDDRAAKCQLAGDAISSKIRAMGSYTMNVGAVAHVMTIIWPNATGRAYWTGVLWLLEFGALVVAPVSYMQYRCTAMTEVASLRARLAQQQARADAEETANEARRPFLRYVMHEARVPANAIRLGLESLHMMQDELPPDAVEAVDDMRTAAENQATIFNSVLSLAAMESGSSQIYKAPASLKDILVSTHRSMLPWAGRIRARLTLDIDPNIPTAMLLDAPRIGQVAANFVSNALKAVPSEGGHVVIRAFMIPGKEEGCPVGSMCQSPSPSCRVPHTSHVLDSRAPTFGVRTPEQKLQQDGRPQPWVRVEVSDNGPGVPASEQGKLFQPYFQISGGHKTVQGTGLGLSIAKETVTRHGGRIGFSPCPRSSGAIFWMELPVEAAERPIHYPAPPMEEMPGRNKTPKLPAALTGGEAAAARRGPMSAEDRVQAQAPARRVVSIEPAAQPAPQLMEETAKPEAGASAVDGRQGQPPLPMGQAPGQGTSELNGQVPVAAYMTVPVTVPAHRLLLTRRKSLSGASRGSFTSPLPSFPPPWELEGNGSHPGRPSSPRMAAAGPGAAEAVYGPTTAEATVDKAAPGAPLGPALPAGLVSLADQAAHAAISHTPHDVPGPYGRTVNVTKADGTPLPVIPVAGAVAVAGATGHVPSRMAASSTTHASGVCAVAPVLPTVVPAPAVAVPAGPSAIVQPVQVEAAMPRPVFAARVEPAPLPRPAPLPGPVPVAVSAPATVPVPAPAAAAPSTSTAAVPPPVPAEVPIVGPTSTTTGAVPGPGAGPVDRRLRFLLVDDVPSNRRLLAKVLQGQAKKKPPWLAGPGPVAAVVLETVEAENGREAVDAMRANLQTDLGQAAGSGTSEGAGMRHTSPPEATRAAGPPKPFDAIFMDAAMPVMDGYEAARQIRGLGYQGPIIGVTGNALDDDQREFLESGASIILTKPVSVQLLEQHVGELLYGHHHDGDQDGHGGRDDGLSLARVNGQHLELPAGAGLRGGRPRSMGLPT